MITAKGTGFLFVAILVFLAGRVTLVGWLYLVDAVLWGILIFSAVVPWLGVSFLDARRRVDRAESVLGGPGLSEGDPLKIEVSLRNHVFFPRFLLSVFYDCPLAEPGSHPGRFFVAQLVGSGQVGLVSTVEAHKRGMHHLGPVILESSAPFGLFRRRRQLSASQPVLVYPKVHPLSRLSLVEGLWGSTAHPRKSPAGVEPVGSRHYFPGDPRRHIHWRNTARAGRPMVKEFEDTDDPTLNLLFDATIETGEGKETTLEYGIKIAASVADYALRHQGPVRVWGGRLRGDTMGQEAGNSMTWPELLRELALVEAGEGQSLQEALGSLFPGSSALVVVSADDQRAVQAVARVAPAMRQLVVVALEGFGGSESGDGLAHSLAMGHVSVIRCRPGRLSETLHSLEQLGAPYGNRSRASAVAWSPSERDTPGLVGPWDAGNTGEE